MLINPIFTNQLLFTTSSPQFTGIELGHATDTTLTRIGAGVVAIEGTNIAMVGGAHHDGFSDFVANEHVAHSGVTITAGTGLTGTHDIATSFTLAVDGVLEDLDTLGANSADSEFLVGTGAGALAWENAATSRTSMGVAIGSDVQAYNSAVNVHSDVDTTTASPSTNDVLKWDGSNWIPGTAGDTGEFTFAIYSFSDALTVVQIGGGEWKAIDGVTFTIVYTYGPATGANITMSSDDAELTLWAVNPLVLPSDYTSDTNASAMNYPDTVNNYIRFALSADKDGGNDTDTETVYFRNKKYYGFSGTTGKLNSAQTLALSGSGFVTASVNNLDTAAHTQTPTGTQYLHFLWPSRISPSNAGTTMFEINGFPTAFTNNGTFTFDNDVGTGYQETYIDYEAPFGYDAALTFEVKADA